MTEEFVEGIKLTLKMFVLEYNKSKVSLISIVWTLFLF